MMPNEDSAYRFIFSLIFPGRPAPGRKHTLLERLTELRDTKNDFLTDDQYREIRSDFLNELASQPRMPFVHLFIFLAFGTATAAGIIFCILYKVREIVWVLGVILAAYTFLWWGMERSYSAKRNLSCSDRLAAVDELLAAELISKEEAVALRIRIEALYKAGAAL